MRENQDPAITSEIEEFIILVEWPGQQGSVLKAARGDTALQVMREKSEKAINLAMGTIQAMAYRVSKTVSAMEDKDRPDNAEVMFGINLDAEAGALLAKATTGAQIMVTLKWNIEQPQRATVLVDD